MIEYILGLNTALLFFIVATIVALYMVNANNIKRSIPQIATPTRIRVMDTIKVSVKRDRLTEYYLAYRSAGYKVSRATASNNDVTLVMVKHIGYRYNS